MPRRRALTHAQIEALLALPTTEPDLIRHFTLSPADLAVIARRRRPHNRLGFAVQLCALRFPGRLLRPGEAVPREVLSGNGPSGWYCQDHDPAKGQGTPGLPPGQKPKLGPPVAPRKLI